MAFTTGHVDAIMALGGQNPSQHWAAFDVSMAQAREGHATRLVTTIWNYHSVKDEQGKRVPTVVAICKDVLDGSLWYCASRPTPRTTRRTWVAHWNRLELARSNGIPIVGVLKDVYTGRCSLEHVFEVGRTLSSASGDAFWMELVPTKEPPPQTRSIDIRALVVDDEPACFPFDVEVELQQAIEQSSQLSREARLDRLRAAPRFPTRIEVTTSVFRRNADVIVEVLARAAGGCEGCGMPAPFRRRSDGSPYLEVHHRVPLAIGGEDTIDNAIALCPNCHRGAHFGGYAGDSEE
ncbi:HNH endonuclease (plasmid) [Ralstonia sp. 25C]|uniref:HNH endonuclease n=1 Tax=Ralstonia sp. 25C TaxID=3447363 RepID=UPI003F756DB1